jgi:general secretion pathway protein E
VYSITRSHDAFLQNIQLLEYERELDIDNVTQRTHEPQAEMTFADDLLKITRADPDVVILPEIRDRNAAVTTAQAAGGKVKFFVAIQANDVLDALRKWLALVGDPKVVARGQLAVINQRLVRKLCEACKAAYKPDPERLRKINMPPDRVLYRPPEPQYDKHGNPIICQGCGGTGYVGRTAVFSILPIDDGLRQVLLNGGALNEIQAYVSNVGGLNLQQQAMHKVLDGTTSIEEVARVTRPAQPAAGAAPSGPKEPTPVSS